MAFAARRDVCGAFTGVATPAGQPGVRQLKQILRAERGTTSGGLHERIRRHRISPPSRQRKQLAVRAIDVDQVVTIVPATLDELQLTTEQRMEPMRHPNPRRIRRDGCPVRRRPRPLRHWARTCAVIPGGTGRDCGCTGTIIVRMDSAYYNAAVISAVRRSGAPFPVTTPTRCRNALMPMTARLRTGISSAIMAPCLACRSRMCPSRLMPSCVSAQLPRTSPSRSTCGPGSSRRPANRPLMRSLTGRAAAREVRSR